jgi:hypothetical protein
MSTGLFLREISAQTSEIHFLDSRLSKLFCLVRGEFCELALKPKDRKFLPSNQRLCFKVQIRLTAAPSTRLSVDDLQYCAGYAETYLLLSMGTTLRRRLKAELTA